MTYVNVPGNKLTSHSTKSLVPCLEQSRLNYLKSQSLKVGTEDQVHSDAKVWTRLHAMGMLQLSSSKFPEMCQSWPLLGSGWTTCSREEADSVANEGWRKLDSDSHLDGSVWNCSKWNTGQKINRCVLPCAVWQAWHWFLFFKSHFFLKIQSYQGSL